MYVYMQRINITLPDNIARDLRKTIPTRSRSKFIADALEHKLDKKRNLKKELLKSLKANRKFYEGIQEDFKHVDAEAFERLS